MLTMDFDIVDWDMRTDEASGYYGRVSVGCLKAFALLQLAQLDPVVAIYGPDWVNGCAFDRLARSIRAEDFDSGDDVNFSCMKRAVTTLPLPSAISGQASIDDTSA